MTSFGISVFGCADIFSFTNSLLLLLLLLLLFKRKLRFILIQFNSVNYYIISNKNIHHQRRVLVNTRMDLRVPYKVSNFMIKITAITFAKTILLRRIKCLNTKRLRQSMKLHYRTMNTQN
jgi:hypothetical protein